MDTFKFDSVARLFGSGMTRRDALRGLVAGAAAVTAGGALAHVEDASARRRRRRNRDNVCARKNWCVDRTHTCGPAGGYGKCLVGVAGKHICGELHSRSPLVTNAEGENCTDCNCVPAEGGTDKCNNGANGYDFICVRKV